MRLIPGWMAVKNDVLRFRRDVSTRSLWIVVWELTGATRLQHQETTNASTADRPTQPSLLAILTTR
jgi:hypothetical protein